MGTIAMMKKLATAILISQSMLISGLVSADFLEYDLTLIYDDNGNVVGQDVDAYVVDEIPEWLQEFERQQEAKAGMPEC